MKKNTLQARILRAGVENCLFMVPMRPIHRVLGIGFTNSANEPLMVPAAIDESRYPIAEYYKVELRSSLSGFGRETFYFMDLEKLIEDGIVQFYVQDHRKAK